MRCELAPAALIAAVCAACASVPPPEAVPTGQLPQDTRPLAYRLELEIDPRSPRFAGRVEIEVELERARSTLWLHGSDLEVSDASVTLPDGSRVEARFESVDPTGVAALRLDRAVGPGMVRARVAQDHVDGVVAEVWGAGAQVAHGDLRGGAARVGGGAAG